MIPSTLRGKFVAIKMHFGEPGNLAFLRPNYARAVVDVVKEQGGKPFPDGLQHPVSGAPQERAGASLYAAAENGFNYITCDCPVIIGDGLRTDDVEVPVHNGELVKNAKIGHAIMDADIIISLSHFKGHEATGFSGAIKNLGMGCGSGPQDGAAFQRQTESQP